MEGKNGKKLTELNWASRERENFEKLRHLKIKIFIVNRKKKKKITELKRRQNF